MNLEEALTSVRELRDQVIDKKAWGNPVALSELAVKLATYNSYVADELATAKWGQLSAEYEAYKKNKKDGASDTGAGDKARLETREARREFEDLRNIYNSTNKMLDVIDTRIYTLHQQIRREGA